MNDLALLELYFEDRGSFHVRKDTGGGTDDPKDMTQAWLDGNIPLYEKLLAEHLKSRPGYTEKKKAVHIPPPRKSRAKAGRCWNRYQKAVDHDRVKELRSHGTTIEVIARMAGCSKSQVARICRGINVGSGQSPEALHVAPVGL